ncbi:MAG: HD domain-containing phosphohydrolase [Planctomycetota bacterium]
MSTTRMDKIMRRGLLVAGAISFAQALIFAGGWLTVYEETHEEVAKGVEEVIVQANVAAAKAVTRMLDGLPNVDEPDSEAWRATQSVIEGLELGGAGFACVLDSDGHISCHPDIEESPGLRDVNLADELLMSLDGESRGRVGDTVDRDVIVGLIDVPFAGKHYLATFRDPGSQARLLVHQPVSGLEAASAHVTASMLSSMIGITALLVTLTTALAMVLTRAHDRTMKRWNESLETTVKERTAQLVKSHRTVLFGIAKLAEHRDNDTGKHVERMCAYSRILAEDYAVKYGGLDPQWVEDIEIAAAMHDIGKVSIPDSILLKPGKLTNDEFDQMKTHAAVGQEALLAVREEADDTRLLDLGIEIAGSHHERWNGRGYPAGIAGESIPLSARIVAVADVFDALMSKRVYKPAMPFEEVCEIIRSESGEHFDPQVVACFERVAPRLKEIHDHNVDAPEPPSIIPYVEAQAVAAETAA